MENYTTRGYAREYAEPQPIYSAPTGVGGLVLAANLLFAIVIIVALIRNETSAVTAIIVGGLYYTAATHTELLILSGALVEIVRTRAEHRTQRELHRLQFAAQTPSEAPAHALPEPDRRAALAPPGLPQTDSYVPAAGTDDSARRAAGMWLLNLYGQDGQVDPKKVLVNTRKERPGRIRIKTPSQPAIDYLVQRHILRPLQKDGQPNGYALNLRYALLTDASRAL